MTEKYTAPGGGSIPTSFVLQSVFSFRGFVKLLEIRCHVAFHQGCICDVNGGHVVVMVYQSNEQLFYLQPIYVIVWSGLKQSRLHSVFLTLICTCLPHMVPLKGKKQHIYQLYSQRKWLCPRN